MKCRPYGARVLLIDSVMSIRKNIAHSGGISAPASISGVANDERRRQRFDVVAGRPLASKLLRHGSTEVLMVVDVLQPGSKCSRERHEHQLMKRGRKEVYGISRRVN